MIEGIPSNQIVLRLLSDTKLCGGLIGKNGSKIKQIRNKCKAKVDIDTSRKGIPRSVISITGDREQIKNAVNLLIDRLDEIGGKCADLELNILATFALAGAIIGTSGNHFKKIKQAAKVYLRFEKEVLPRSNEKLGIIKGKPDNVRKAFDMILMHYFSAYETGSAEGVVYYVPEVEDFYNANSQITRPYDESRGYRETGMRNACYREPPMRLQEERSRFRERSPGYFPQSERFAPQERRGREFGYRANPEMREMAYHIDDDFGREPPRNSPPPPRQLLPYPPHAEVKLDYPINKGLAGILIGRGGHIITRIREDSGAHVKLRKERSKEPFAVVTVSGLMERVRHALFLIDLRIRDK